jgi:hypothetical protein
MTFPVQDEIPEAFKSHKTMNYSGKVIRVTCPLKLDKSAGWRARTSAFPEVRIHNLLIAKPKWIDLNAADM